MKNTKLLIRVLVCILAMALALSACNGTTDNTTITDAPTTGGDIPVKPPVVDPPDVKEDGYKVTFKDTAMATIETSIDLSKRVEENTTVSFTVKNSVFYTGTPVVKAGGEELTPNAQGMYSFKVTADTVITVEGLTLKASQMQGAGTSDEPYLITEPVDLLKIAEEVNAGNAAYAGAHYRLENDLDFEGGEMAVIGNGSSDETVFAGYFDGNGKTISNYRIVSNSSAYVGLFGVLQINMGDSAGGTVFDLHLKDFEISATIVDGGAYIGSFVGYGMAGKLQQCTAENGKIEVYAGANSFSFAGGLMGCQSALDYGDYAFYSYLLYCTADVDVRCNSGLVYSAGGLVGYMAGSPNNVPSHIENCYATGDVSGAMRSGGLVGMMTKGNSVTNSYATGAVSAQTPYSDVDGYSAEYSYAYAGGLVGYAECNSIVSECFSVSELNAVAALGQSRQLTDAAVAFAEQPGEYDYGFAPCVVYNCAADKVTNDILKNTLHWHEIDWVFGEGYPTINLESESEYTFTVTVVAGEEKIEMSADFYMPMYYYYSADIFPYRLPPKEGSTMMSYGYFFDEECTQLVPAGYVPSHDITLYAGMADTADIAGEYELMVKDSDTSIRLELTTGSTYIYSDMGQTTVGEYVYNGETIIFQDARFGRFQSGAADMMHYQFYDFCATVGEDGRLYIIGGVEQSNSAAVEEEAYFTPEAPLVAIPLKNVLFGEYTDGNGIYTFYADGTGYYETAADLEEVTYTRDGESLRVTVGNLTLTGTVKDGVVTLGEKILRQPDAFKGSWNIDSKANKIFTFDGAGNWSYVYSGNKVTYEIADGTYTVNDDLMTLTGDMTGTATFDKNGALLVTVNGKTASYHRDGGFYGTWVYPDYGMTLYLNGINANGQGTARVEYLYENGTIEFYDMLCALDEVDSSVLCLYYRQDENAQYEVFGYMRYRSASDLLDATVYVGSEGTFMSNVLMGAVDDLDGQWIGLIDAIPTLDFNGYGGYTIGEVTIGEDQVSYTLYDCTLTGTFLYDGKLYSLCYDEATETLSVTCDGKESIYIRKDAYADLTLTDGENNYTFDGRGEFGGTVYVNGEAAYDYRISGNDVHITKGGKQVGSISIGETTYHLELDGSAAELRIRSSFTGTWAMSASPEAYITIGTFGADGKAEGKLLNTRDSKKNKDLKLTVLPDGSLKCLYGEEEVEYYVVAVGESNLVLALQRDWYLQQQYDAMTGIYNYYVLAPMDDLFGTWSTKLGAAYSFDGMGDSKLCTGLAQSGMVNDKGEFDGEIAYQYGYNKRGDLVLWTADDDGTTIVWRINFCDVSTRGAFIREDGKKAFTVEKGDKLYNMTATDRDTEIVYEFDGFGKVTTSDGNTYDYTVKNINYTDYVATAEIVIDGVTYTATIEYNQVTPTITLETK